MTILLQVSPSVKSITGDFLRIGLICFRCSKGIIAEVLDQDGIHGTDEDTGIGELGSDRLVVSAGVLHAYFRLAIQSLDNTDQG